MTIQLEDINRIILEVNDNLDVLKSGLMIMRSGNEYFIYDKRSSERLSINGSLSDVIATGISCIRELPE